MTMFQPAPRATKIVATLGPASSDPDVLERMLRAGVNVVRVNFSHGTAAEHAESVRRVREIAGRIMQSVGVLADLQGPKIRLGTFATGSAALEAGATFTLTTESVRGDATIASTSCARPMPRPSCRM